MVDDRVNVAVRKLYSTYKLYYLVSAPNGDKDYAAQYAEECTNGYLDYYKTCNELYDWNDVELFIENQIRILNGFIECYDKPVIRENVTQKTRWSL
jgi:hypothetical protein